MLYPNPALRISAMQAYHHPALQLSAPTVIITPHFVRAAQTIDDEEPIPSRPSSGRLATAAAGALKEAKKKRQVKKKESKLGLAGSGAGTKGTPALGESIKQHTSMPRLKGAAQGQAQTHGAEGEKAKSWKVEGMTPSPKKEQVVIRSQSQARLGDSGDKENSEGAATTRMLPDCGHDVY